MIADDLSSVVHCAFRDVLARAPEEAPTLLHCLDELSQYIERGTVRLMLRELAEEPAYPVGPEPEARRAVRAVCEERMQELSESMPEVPSLERSDVSSETLSFIAYHAARYAAGRGTYMNDVIADFTECVLDRLTPSVKEDLAAVIGKRLGRCQYSAPDMSRWLEVYRRLRK